MSTTRCKSNFENWRCRYCLTARWTRHVFFTHPVHLGHLYSISTNPAGKRLSHSKNKILMSLLSRTTRFDQHDCSRNICLKNVCRLDLQAAQYPWHVTKFRPFNISNHLQIHREKVSVELIAGLTSFANPKIDVWYAEGSTLLCACSQAGISMTIINILYKN